MYYTYMLRCEDNSIYTGITTNLERRMKEHFEKGDKCAKYTLRHSATILERAWETEDRVYASKLEYFIKQLPKNKKEILIKDARKLNRLLGDRIASNMYKSVKKSEIVKVCKMIGNTK